MTADSDQFEALAALEMQPCMCLDGFECSRCKGLAAFGRAGVEVPDETGRNNTDGPQTQSSAGANASRPPTEGLRERLLGLLDDFQNSIVWWTELHPESASSADFEKVDEIIAARALLDTQPEPAGEPSREVGCHDCGRLYGDEHGFPDLVVPHDVWKKHLSPTGDEGGLLCPSCMVKRAADAGIVCAATWKSGPFTGPQQQEDEFERNRDSNWRDKLDNKGVPICGPARSDYGCQYCFGPLDAKRGTGQYECPWCIARFPGPGPQQPVEGATDAIKAMSAPQPESAEPIALARRFHEAYERLAPSFGYETRKESAVAWDDVPEQNRALMIATVREVFTHPPHSGPTIEDEREMKKAAYYAGYEQGWNDRETSRFAHGVEVEALNWLATQDTTEGA